MKVNEMRTLVGVDWPLCPRNRGERSTSMSIAQQSSVRNLWLMYVTHALELVSCPERAEARS